MSQVSFVRSAVAAALLIASGTPAVAADLYGNQPPPQPYAGYTQQSPLSNWAGAYLGVQAGYSFGTLKNAIAGVGTLKNSMNGANIGLYAGVNAAISGNIIVGAEGDLNLSDRRSTQTQGLVTYKGTSSWNGTIRGRLGMSFDRYLPYVTTGLAFADHSLSRNGVSDNTTQVGWAIGAGLEGFVTDRITLKGELLYQGFGDLSHTIAGESIKTNMSQTILRLGAAYKF